MCFLTVKYQLPLSTLVLKKCQKTEKSHTLDEPCTQEPIDQVVPNKTRCGSQDPVEMSADTKCYCWPKERRGARKTFFAAVVYPLRKFFV